MYLCVWGCVCLPFSYADITSLAAWDFILVLSQSLLHHWSSPTQGMVSVTEEGPESSRWNSHHTMSFYDQNDQKELRRPHHSVVWFCCNVIIICSIFRQMLEAVPGNIVQIFMVPRGRIPPTLGMLWVFIYFHHHSRFSVCPAVQIYDQILAKLTAWQSNCTFCLRFWRFISRY